MRMEKRRWKERDYWLQAPVNLSPSGYTTSIWHPPLPREYAGNVLGNFAMEGKLLNGVMGIDVVQEILERVDGFIVTSKWREIKT